ncbi:MAG TPA: hypothetical protein VFU02_05845 [Polyangiaceae bacterium]|nr:hypothetical protein [Polyangiaceae bacterium]
MRSTPTSTALGLIVASLTACSTSPEPNANMTASGGPTSNATGTGTAAGTSTTTHGAGTLGTASATAAGGTGTSGGGTLGSGGATVTGTTSVVGSTAAATSAGSSTTDGTGAGGGQVSGTGGASSTGTSSAGTSSAGTTTGGPLPEVYGVEDTGADCSVTTTFPEFSALPSIPEFPDPFLMESGERITTRADWRCRRAEISAQIQQWELGTKPAPSEGEVSATFSGNTLTVNVQVGSESITLTTTIDLPASGSAPYPAVIRMAGSGVPIGGAVASMNFSDGQLAGQFPTRGDGPFWDLFPDSTVGAYAGWAWGVSRIIDGLELTAEQNQIDTTRLAVTGCSYAGKMALWAGAFDERIALTIPQESGGGGEAAWRFMANQPETEHLEAAQGTGWYSERLEQFGNADAPKLPFDQHSLVAMIAPRAVLAIQNTAIERLGSEAGGASMRAAAEVYEALGIPERIGFSQAPASGHCQFPASQQPDVDAFVSRFLLGDESIDTNIMKDAYATDMAQWIPWETPTLP